MKRTIPTIFITAVIMFVGGFWLRGFFQGDHANHSHPERDAARSVKFYTCSMHPSIQQDTTGTCSVCGMDLIPVYEGDAANTGPRSLSLSPRAQKLAEIQSTPVERRYAEAEIRMVGKVEYDESRLSYITARVPGRLDRLYVDYTGVPVKQNDHLVYLYSPDLLNAQEELIAAIRTAGDLESSSSGYLRERSQENIRSAREKLRLWGLTESQIADIEQRGSPSDHITINSPMEGIVVHKNAVEGMYVQTGTPIYTIADLTHVWVKLDAYESDLPWIHYGQEVEFRTEAYPGEVFKGKIAFIDPVLNAKTRTIKMRVNLPNPQGKLKPDMFVRAVVKSQIAKGGRVMDPNLAGKWISPMHPEIIKNEPGACDICGMDLVSAESLGYVTAQAETAPLVIPSSAPLITGKRAVVYVDLGQGQYEGREIELGPRAGDFYLVESGLQEGEKVVTNGNFKIDSAIQILAKPSMMQPQGGKFGGVHTHDHGSHTEHEAETTQPTAFPTPPGLQDSLDELVSLYMEIQHALSHDDQTAANSSTTRMETALDSVPGEVLEGEAQTTWNQRQTELQQAVSHMKTSGEDMGAMRQGFEHLSNTLIQTLRQFRPTAKADVYLYHCPMAFGGKGGDWLQSHEGTENPYYGSKMFTCGALKETLVTSGINTSPNDSHEE
jgi:Cu(I)/Ag(I) efflux system membrane fusion protein